MYLPFQRVGRRTSNFISYAVFCLKKKNEALSDFYDILVFFSLPASSPTAWATSGLKPNPPNRAAAPAPAAAAFISLRRSSETNFLSVITSSLRPRVPGQSSRRGGPWHRTLLRFNTRTRTGNDP